MVLNQVGGSSGKNLNAKDSFIVVTISEQYQWYPVYTNPRAEKTSQTLLAKKGIEVYLPLQKQLKTWSDRKKWVEEPLIKSYVFVKISVKQQPEVLMTNGICRFLYFSGKIASMPEKQIDQLKLLMANEAELEILDYSFKKGEEVYVKAGPLQGMKGELITFHSQKKLLLRFDHIGQSVIIQVPLAFVEPL